MKKIFTLITVSLMLALSACQQDKSDNQIIFATSATAPPFEYKVDGKLTGFGIALGKLVAETLGKEAVFQDMQFASVLAAVQSGVADAALATITVTDARKKNFDFSNPYYVAEMGIVFNSSQPLKNTAQLAGKKIACQLGSTMEIWLRKHLPAEDIVTFDSSYQSMEALKSGYVDGAMMDYIQAAAFAKKTARFGYAMIGKADSGYAIAFKKGSPLLKQVNQALKKLQENDKFEVLKQKYLVVD